MRNRTGRLKLLCLTGVVLALVSACGAGAPPTGDVPQPQQVPAPPEGSGGQLVLSGTLEGAIDFEVYRVNADGTGLTNLAQNPARDMLPAWSSRGAIAFTSDRDGKTEIYLMAADGSGVMRLTDDAWEKGVLRDTPYLEWSPDGAWLAYTASLDGQVDIFVIRPDGADLANLSDNPATDGQFHWSPDSRHLVFSSDRDGGFGLYTVKVDGSGLRKLVGGTEANLAGGWSPDGKRIVYTTNVVGNWEIYTIKADGSDAVRLTDHPGSDFDPAYSLSGDEIAFRSDRDGAWALYLMGADGANPRSLYGGEGNEYYFWWAPDGKRIYVTWATGEPGTILEWSGAIVTLESGERRPFVVGYNVTWHR